MTLQDIIAMDVDFLTPAQIASVLNCSPQLIRVQVAKNPELVGFSFCKFGNRIHIPRLAFIEWVQHSTLTATAHMCYNSCTP